MGKKGGLLGRGSRYIRKYGAAQLYRKIRERQKQNWLERDYGTWLAVKQPGPEELEKQRAIAASFESPPVFSILVPAYETPAEFLCQMVDSVCAQTYEGWELCIADGSETRQVEEALKLYLERDARIHYRHLEQNQGISGNSNAALAMARGDFVALLDHDDLLFPQTLYEVALALQKQPLAEALYTDEDKVSFDLKRHFQPHFKPDFNRELLRSNNYICHFFVVKRELAKRVGGFLQEFDGAQDYDFILRCVEQARKVVHIPQILYSWRSHAASTAANPESKLYAYEAGRRAIKAHLERQGEQAKVLHTSNYGFYRVKYQMLPEKTKGRETEINLELINSFENIHRQTGIKVVYYGKMCNKIVTIPQKDVTDKGYVLVSRVRRGRFQDGFLEELLSVCQRQETGMACARVYGVNGRLSHPVEMAGVHSAFCTSVEGLKKGYLGYFHRACLQQEIVRPTDCFMMRGELFWELQRLYSRELFSKGKKGVSFDSERETLEEQKFLNMDWLVAEVKRRGYRIIYNPWAVLYERK